MTRGQIGLALSVVTGAVFVATLLLLETRYCAGIRIDQPSGDITDIGCRTESAHVRAQVFAGAAFAIAVVWTAVLFSRRALRRRS